MIIVHKLIIFISNLKKGIKMKKIIVIISLMTLVFAQAEWNGLSVANSDDLMHSQLIQLV